MKDIYKAIIFSRTPLKGFFRFENEFQIYPVEANILSSEKYKHYPIFLEFKILSEDIIKPNFSLDGLEDLISHDSISETATIQTKQDKIINLLNLFSTFKFFRYNKAEGNWILPITSKMAKEEIQNIEGSEFLYSHFFNKKIDFEIDDFSNMSSNYNLVEMVQYSEYYQNDPNYDYNPMKEITFPNNMIYALQAYSNLSLDEKKIVDSAIRYSVLSMELMDDKTTLGILSAFTSIETVMNFYYKDFKPEQCSSCGQPKYKISKRYLDFLLNFIGDGEGFKKRFNNLYSLRSKIVHTGFSFATEPFWNELNDIEKDSETITILEIVMLSKLSIINYLVLPFMGKKNKHHN